MGGMPVTSHVVEYGGQYVGHAISLGERVQFHTTLEKLTALNERCFDSLTQLQETVTNALFVEHAS